jgi:hypothetical protein
MNDKISGDGAEVAVGHGKVLRVVDEVAGSIP